MSSSTYIWDVSTNIFYLKNDINKSTLYINISPSQRWGHGPLGLNLKIDKREEKWK